MLSHNNVSDHSTEVRNRLLTYSCSMGIPTIDSLEIVIDVLRRIPHDASMSVAMSTLWDILQEKHYVEYIEAIHSMPPHSRSSMIAEHIDRAPWITKIKRYFHQLSEHKND